MRRTSLQPCNPVSYTHLDVYKRQHFWLNPRAELLGALWRHAGAVRVPWLAAVTEAVVQAIETRDQPLAGNDLHCVLRLAATPQTVSYTHLDVYKRQALACSTAMKRSRSRSP